jgi:DNA-directed RNA polymerase subunit M/transcription elongation factor TFIIS
MIRDNKRIVAIVTTPVGDRRCGRCGGNVLIDRDADGWFVQCLQCGHRWEVREIK